jgi:NAD(P)H-hydrate epimerase
MEVKMLNHNKVLNLLPDRQAESHKGTYGKILLLCGSRGYTGAAALAAMGALRSGAGLVYLAVPESIYTIEAVKLTEPVIYPVFDENGMYAPSSVEKILSIAQGKNAILIGSGMGQSEGTLAATKAVLENYPGPVVLDADGINVMKAHKDVLRGRPYPTILTPHPGEFQRFTGNYSDDRIAIASELAMELGVIVLLKGHKTVITDGVSCYINPTGNPGMATGGSGDVLSGIIVSLLGQGLKPLEAAACGAWLHGAAGDICASEIGQYGMIPSDMIQVLPRLLK